MSRYISGLLLACALLVFVPRSAAHCDSLGGPVIADAKLALKSGEVTPVLKWIRKEDEAELRALFARVLAVHEKGTDVREMSEQYFFETVVRLHRSSEGAPYTGLKPEAVAHDPVIEGVDESLANGSAQELVNSTAQHLKRELSERFDRALSARKKAAESVEAGRAYVRAYVELVHYVEGLHGVNADEQMRATAKHEHE